MKIIAFTTNDLLTLKKPHPCGGLDFTVLRCGSDIHIRCNGCGRDMMIPRVKLEKSIRLINGKAPT